MAGIGQLSEPALHPDPRDGPPTQPAASPASWDAAAARPVSAAAGIGLPGLHADAVLDFVNPGGFGYVKDRRHVVGFQPHGFSKVPAPSVRRVELVGLLLHPGPVVYVSEKLPAMGELRAARTRALDLFEAKGLAAVRGGEDLVAEESGGVARAVGAIRSVRRCVGCHVGEWGDLLGAFSYTLAGPTP